MIFSERNLFSFFSPKTRIIFLMITKSGVICFRLPPPFLLCYEASIHNCCFIILKYYNITLFKGICNYFKSCNVNQYVWLPHSVKKKIILTNGNEHLMIRISRNVSCVLMLCNHAIKCKHRRQTT